MRCLFFFFAVFGLTYAAPSKTTAILYRDTHVVGGTEADVGEFPFLLSLQQIMSGKGYHICGAAVYNQYWAITAAHCVYGRVIHEDYMQIVAGEHSLSSNDGSEQTIGVVLAIIHDNFDVITYENDIALLRLQVPLVFNQYVQPTNLPSPGFNPRQDCVFSGWGATQEEGSETDTPQKVWLPIVSDATCSSHYAQSGIIIFPSMICAGLDEGGVDACSKDDGGPLVCKKNGNDFLTGISSFGYGCARPYKPGIYTEISHFRQWIEENTDS